MTDATGGSVPPGPAPASDGPGDAGSVLLLPPAQRVEPSRAGPFPPSRRQTPTRARQRERLAPRFQALQDAFDAQRAELRGDVVGVEPEQVVVLEVAGTVDKFTKAVHRVQGMEFLGEQLLEDLEPDDDFALLDPRTGDRTDRLLTGTLFLVMTNQRAMRELRSLWERWIAGQDRDPGVFRRGLGRFRSLFELLRDVRPWGPHDRVASTGVLDEWRGSIESDEQVVPVEVELWYRSIGRQRTAERQVRALIEDEGGTVTGRSLVEDIAYHALLAELPRAAVERVLADGAEAIQLARSGYVLFLRPVGQIAAPVVDDEPDDGDAERDAPSADRRAGWPKRGEGTDADEAAGAAPSQPSREQVPDEPRPPVAALLDGLPLERHARLDGRLVVDDPDGWGATYEARDRRHGTAMASLVLHGDLDDRQRASSPGSRPVYVRPIMRPDPRASGPSRVEIVPVTVLPVDLMLRAFRRIFEGEGREGPVAPSVRIVNLSVGDPAVEFVYGVSHGVSAWARVLDWLAWTYRVVVVVAAGNHPRPLTFPMAYSALEGLDPEERQARALVALVAAAEARPLLSPAEAVNAVTVGAAHADASMNGSSLGRVDLLASPHLPSPIGPLARGVRRAVKPEVLLPGGRQLYRQRSSGPTQAVVEPARSGLRPPGQRVAAPSRTGALDATVFSCGTSNAAALATGLAVRIHDVLVGLREEPGGEVLDDEHLPVAIKALLVHGADWSEGHRALTGALPEWSKRRRASRVLGYGAVEKALVLDVVPHRVTLLGVGTLKERQAEQRSFPLPPSLSGKAGRRRLTATLAWLTPIRPTDRWYRCAHLWFDTLASPLTVSRQQADKDAARRGTVQHEVFEGTRADAFVDGEHLHVRVNCREDAAGLGRQAVPYALALSLEVAPELGVPVREEVRSRVQPLVRVAAQA